MLRDSLRDVVVAIRGLRRDPTFTFVAVLALALGIGANSSVFSAINAIINFPLAVADPLRTVFIWQTNEELGFTQVPVSIAFVRLLSSQLEGIAAAGGGGPLTFVAVSLVLLAVAQIASLVPAWRSVKVDPVAALRMD